MILVCESAAGVVAIVIPVRPPRPAVDAVIQPEYIDADTGETVPARELAPAIPAETEADYRAAIEETTPAGYTARAWIDPAALPAPELAVIDTGADAPQIAPGNGREYRNAWRWDGAAVVIDPAARAAQQLDRVRAIRNRLLANSDGDMLRETERGNATRRDALANYRQALRDIPQTWDGDLASLAAAWPVRPA